MTNFNLTNHHPKIYRLDAKESQGILDGFVVGTEKIDGSQIGWGVVKGELVIRSKGAYINPECVPGLFKGATETILKAHANGLLKEGQFFYGESVETPRHNRLHYGRVPEGHIVLFGGFDTDGRWFSWGELETWAQKFECERVAILVRGDNVTEEEIETIVQNTSSQLGGIMEGMVIRVADACAEMRWAKYVRPEFKEVQKVKKAHAAPIEKISDLFAGYCTESRWHKAWQHLADDGVDMTDKKVIGQFMSEIVRDTLEEEEQEIKDALFKIFRKQFNTAITKGAVEWALARM